MNHVRLGNRTYLLAHHLDEVALELIRRVDSFLERHVAIDALAFDVMRIADDGCFRHVVMQDERALNFSGTHPVPRHVQDIIDAARDPVVPILIAATSITRKVLVGEGREVRFNEAAVIPIDRSCLTRPRIFHHENAFGRALKDFSILINNLRLHTEERECSRTRLCRCCARQR